MTVETIGVEFRDTVHGAAKVAEIASAHGLVTEYSPDYDVHETFGARDAVKSLLTALGFDLLDVYFDGTHMARGVPYYRANV